MKDGSVDSDTNREYEDLSSYEDEDEVLVAAPPATKKQAIRLPAAKSAGKKSQPAKTHPQNPPPGDNRLVKAMVIHGASAQRPMSDITQVVGARGIMGPLWLLGDIESVGKATSSVVVFFDKKLALGSHLKVRGRWVPIEADDFDRGRRRVECSDW